MRMQPFRASSDPPPTCMRMALGDARGFTPGHAPTNQKPDHGRCVKDQEVADDR